MYPANEESTHLYTSILNSVSSLKKGGTTKALRFSSLCG